MARVPGASRISVSWPTVFPPSTPIWPISGLPPLPIAEGREESGAGRGRQEDDKTRQFLHRGIAARQFQRAFVLAEGIEILGADLKDGLLSIDLARPEPERIVRRIEIDARD